MSSIADLSSNLPITIFISGFATATFLAAGLFFLKFWSRSREAFFLLFGIACWMFSLERTVWMIFFWDSQVATIWLPMFRIAGFILIFLAILRANGKRLTHS